MIRLKISEFKELEIAVIRRFGQAIQYINGIHTNFIKLLFGNIAIS